MAPLIRCFDEKNAKGQHEKPLHAVTRADELVGPEEPARRLLNREMDSRRWRIEAVFSRLKNFAVLRHPFLHKLSRHRLVFLAVVAAFNVDVVLHPLIDRM